MTMSPGPLAAKAQLFRVDVYPTGVVCDGARIAAHAPTPMSSMSFLAGQAIRLDVPPGHYAVVLVAFADDRAAVEIGTACTEADFAAGDKPCLDLTLSPVDGAAPRDASIDARDAAHDAAPDAPIDLAGDLAEHCDGAGCPCTSAPDSCPTGTYCASGTCAPGCKADAECTSPGAMRCSPSRHQCVACVVPNDCPSGQLCTASGACATGCDPAQGKTCAAGLTCCNKMCIDTASDPLNCGACGATCGGQLACCASQCVNLLSDVGNCGKCATACSTVNATASCSAGSCAWTCTAGFAHCASGNTGCESSLTSTQSCGGCGNACDVTNATAAMCDGMRCSYACKAGFGDCVQKGADTDGCESSLSTVLNCSACGRACDSAHSTPSACNAGACVYSGCANGYADCAMGNGDLDGCETDLGSVQSCGACGRTCVAANASFATCLAGACSYMCNAGFADCVTANGDLDGCETSLSSTSSCGGCNNTCNAANATSAMCDGTRCSYACKAGFADCVKNGADTDGCESSLASTSSCGACGNLCDGTNAAQTSCNGTSCLYTCKTGFADCVKMGADTDGCETSLTATSSCGACGNVCNVTNAQTASCDGTTCSYQCKFGFADCVKTGADTDGCETSALTVSNCGGCNNVCDTAHSTGVTCNGVQCIYGGCQLGYTNCNTTPPDVDGCETQEHQNGLGEFYIDCPDKLGMPGSAGTYNSSMAADARAVWPNAGTDSSSCTCTVNNVVEQCVARFSATECTMWTFTGLDAGYVKHNVAPGTNGKNCACPLAGVDLTWN
jgi:hypothetical protein